MRDKTSKPQTKEPERKQKKKPVGGEGLDDYTRRVKKPRYKPQAR